MTAHAPQQLTVMDDDSLEANSLWYQYKSLVWQREHNPISEAIHNTMRTLRAFRNNGPLAYVSVPITSGQRFYEMKIEHPGMEMKELMTQVMWHNYQMGNDQVGKVIERRRCPTLYPADLVPARQKWRQEDFQALWLTIIAEFCTEVHLSPGWGLSNGGIEEAIHVFQLRLGLPKPLAQSPFYNTKGEEERERDRMRRISLFDQNGEAVSADDLYKAIEECAKWLEVRGFSTDHHKKCLFTLSWTQKKMKQFLYQ